MMRMAMLIVMVALMMLVDWSCPCDISTFSTVWIDQPIDHFNARITLRFSERVLISTKYWNTQKNNAPVIFYTGNEGDIVWFAKQSGFLCDVVAPSLGALIVFAEHRYFGETMPFGKNASMSNENIGFLSVPQALADFANVIQVLQTQYYGHHDAPVIAAGGSYGGMLAAWMRIKYPHLVVGALSASGPVLQFDGFASTTIFNEIVEQTFEKEGGHTCNENIRESFAALVDNTDFALLNRIFRPCEPIASKAQVASLIDWITNAITYLPMMDYPYPSSFLQPLPAWPVRAFCAALCSSSSASSLLPRLASALSVYYNSTGTHECNELSSEADASLGAEGWDYLACTQLIMPMEIPPGSMLPSSSWNFTSYSEDCFKRWSVRPDLHWASTEFGGDHIKASSNIVFSNGELDPWRGGGVTASLSNTLIAVIIEDGAHHLDLRAPNARDPSSVRKARSLHLRQMHIWIQQHNDADEANDVESF